METDLRTASTIVDAQSATAADNTRRARAKLSFWLTAAMLFGAFAASLATVEGEDIDVTAFIKTADDNLYKAKREGRNRVIG